MKAAVLHRYDEKLTSPESEDVGDPKIANPADAVVRIGGAGVCRTALHIVGGVRREQVSIALQNAGRVEADACYDRYTGKIHGCVVPLP